MHFCIVVRYEFDRSWLRLSRDQRAEYERVFQEEIVGPYSDRLAVQHCDAEAFSADYSDFLLITTEDLQAYYFFIETLRDSAFVAEGYVRIHDISIGIADGYREYENA